MIQVALEHRSSYRFSRPVQVFPHVVRLRPAPHCRTPVLAYSLRVEPAGHFVNWQQDPFGNHLARFVFPEPVEHLDVTVDLIAAMTVVNPFDFFVDEEARHYPFGYEPALHRDLAPYLEPPAGGPLFEDWIVAARAMAAGGPAVIDLLVALNQAVQGEIAYTVRLEAGVQTPEETLAKRLGSCRDSAWLLVGVLRRLGLAARFASGYLVQLTADVASLDGPSGPAADFTDLHAWAEVYVPGAGWIGLDPTSGLFAGEGHLPLACTPEPASAAPITGSTEPCDVTFEHANSVRRIHEDPRVTLPYSDAQWAAVDALGSHVDEVLTAGDVRLTMGGEPTFVSVDDMEAAEWNTVADGEHKRRLAHNLTRRLAGRFAPGGLAHHGQGKWYPGEPLPRWQMALYWRVDGIPLWRDPGLLADPGETGTADAGDAHRLAVAIAARLGIAADFAVPAYEDPVRSLWTEASLPPDLPADAAERRTLVARLDNGTRDPAGWVVPLHATGFGVTNPALCGVRDPKSKTAWATTRWAPRRGAIFLVSGDSPLGLRLPLAALVAEAVALDPDRSTFEARPPLPGVPGVGPGPSPTAAAESGPGGDRGRDPERAGATVIPVPALVVPAGEAPPTALCVEIRDGRAHVFLPPLRAVENAVALIAAVEDSAAAAGLPVVVEGYPPPADPRLRTLAVTPDPGVIEVNMAPAGTWGELVETVTVLYDEAHQSRLGTEKFALDGAHSGTGGGNHMTLGGPSAPDSPILRRPDLLRSLLTYWQHHPSLSYLFSGRFIGPTSQAPRIDEARHDSLDELEIAFAELDRLGTGGAASPLPWIVDRLFRHLLVDVSGNTHRAEFCIDKLFSPDGERGRLGLVELRGFEMPPHPRMALVQALLVRALLARCWHEPYRGPLVRWGTELHDRFLLPHHVAADAGEVVDDLRRAGFAFEAAWLAPFVEFRFPHIGSVEVGGAHIELRAAIEPWPVLGEESTGGGMARLVDSSVERLQVAVAGITAGRHVLTCNGVPVPLHPTGTPGTAVAGVRYRAWQPPSCLHPTIPVHAPLVFDLVDRWNGRSLGGCTYHVAHPGGRAYDRFPVNANEAEARRTNRFLAHGHTPGPVDPAVLAAAETMATPSRGAPHTLDLRRSSARGLSPGGASRVGGAPTPPTAGASSGLPV